MMKSGIKNILHSLSILLLILIHFSFGYNLHGDPTKQEIDLFDWTSGALFYFCNEIPIQETANIFRSVYAKVLNKYCLNSTNPCQLTIPTNFQSQNIVFLDGFPRREYSNIHLKFVVVYPHNVRPEKKQLMPLLPRSVLSGLFTNHGSELENRLGWEMISHERFPRFSSTTEFMNVAIIPIVIFTLPLMIFLAYWTSSLRPNMSSESWLVMGSSGGKNYAYRRTLQIIAEENEEIERQRKIAVTRHLPPFTPPREAVGRSADMLLDVARLSIKSASSSSLRQMAIMSSAGMAHSSSQPLITIQPSSDTPSLHSNQPQDHPVSPITSRRLTDVPEHSTLQIEPEDLPGPSVPVYSSPSHLVVKSPHRHRRLSSVDEISSKRRNSRSRAISMTTSSGGRKWKAGSLILFGGRK